ncbi:MAG: glycoside hydrolase family 95 protein [Clostridia bacterium]|nr:glycoside hydrolase family 95 protein [Clostridia bacterium]
MREYKIFDTVEPKEWIESVPVGNGRMGATLMCGVQAEELYLNEESVWSSIPNFKASTEMYQQLGEIRKLFLENKVAEANKLAENLSGSLFQKIRCYESAGKLKISLHENNVCRNYKHELDLINGCAKITYSKDGSNFTRECFASFPDDVIVYRVTSDNHPFNARVMYDRPRVIENSSENNIITATAQTIWGNHKYCVKAKVTSDGKITAQNGELYVENARNMYVYISIGTEFRHGDSYIENTKLPDKEYDDIKTTHTEDFSSLMKRADIDVPHDPYFEEIEMSMRRKASRFNRLVDDGLVLNQWQLGRYLLVSTSREGCLPANLQGLWTEGDYSAWNADYHTNINIQCNYWLSEVANLSECHMPLFDYMNKYLLEQGKETAKIGYHTRGTVVHHLSDIYGFTAPADGVWGLWPHGASWLALHMWEHYLYTQDIDFLKNTAYEFIRQSALFFLDYMMEDNQGRLLMGPSMSPENKYYAIDSNGQKQVCYLTMSSAMDVGIITELLNMYIAGSEVLGISDADTEYAKKALTKMPKYGVGKNGQLMEWLMEDYEEVDSGHFHLSPGFAVFPGSSINRKTPEIQKAALKMLRRRIENGHISRGNAAKIGWSSAWSTAMFARFRCGDEAYKSASDYVSVHDTVNMFDLTELLPYGKVFQVDGMMSFTAGVCEMLIQSHEGTVAVIPALPIAWPRGSFRGLKARGNFELDLTWKDYKAEKITIKGNGKCCLELPETQISATLKGSDGKIYTAKDGIIDLVIDNQLTLSC